MTKRPSVPPSGRAHFRGRFQKRLKVSFLETAKKMRAGLLAIALDLSHYRARPGSVSGRAGCGTVSGDDGSAERTGALIRAERERRELSLGKLAARAGVSTSTLS